MFTLIRRWLEDWHHRHDFALDQLRAILPECQECGRPTAGFDERGPLCIDCAVVKAMREGI